MNRGLLTEEFIISEIEAYFDRNDKYPTAKSGGRLSNGDTWAGVDCALRVGFRGLSSGSSLSKLRKKLLGDDRRLTKDFIIDEIKAYLAKHGRYPTTVDSHRLSNGDSWKAICSALKQGGRGLPGGTSLHRFIVLHFNRAEKKDLTCKFIISEIKAYFNKHDKYPSSVTKAPLSNGDNWSAVSQALRAGTRGLPGDSSLAKLINRHFHRKTNTPLTEEFIISEIKAYFNKHDKYPTTASKERTSEGISWGAVNQLLVRGRRGLPGGSSLSKVINSNFDRSLAKRLTEEFIISEIKAYCCRNYKLPTSMSTEKLSNGDTWCAVNDCLNRGIRGLPGGSSLAKFKKQHFKKEN